jgi:hypothetical protein
MNGTHVPNALARMACVGSLLGVLFAAGCGGDDADDDPGSGSVSPKYAVSSWVFSPEGDVSYVSLVSSLEEGEIDYSKALETAGGAFMYPIEGNSPKNALFLGLLGDVGIQRVDITDGGALEPGPVMALSQLGVTYPPYESVLFLGEDKAWLIDFWGQLQVIVWNPATMEIERTFDVPELAREGYETALGRLRHLGGDLYVAPVAWYDYTNNVAYPVGGAAIFDAQAERLVALLEDDRCAGLENAVLGGDGHMYLTSGGYYGMLQHFLHPGLPAPCALRIKANESAFDEGFALDLRAAAGGRPTGVVMPRGDGGFWLTAWHEDRYPTPPIFGEANTVEAWRWWKLELPSGAVAEETTTPWHGGSAQAFLTGDRTYTSLAAADYSEATIYDMSHSGGPRPGISVRGGLYGIAKLIQDDK